MNILVNCDYENNVQQLRKLIIKIDKGTPTFSDVENFKILLKKFGISDNSIAAVLDRCGVKSWQQYVFLKQTASFPHELYLAECVDAGLRGLAKGVFINSGSDANY